jgi:predicted GIY-YIG superfamily endonuclease
MQTTCIYVVQLEHGKYYVSASDDPEKELEELREGLGIFWTQIHKPVRIVERSRFKRIDELDRYTKLAMRKYGLEHVRGGSWESARLSDRDRQVLHDEIINDTGCITC